MVFEPPIFSDNTEITAGQAYEPAEAPKDMSRKSLVKGFLSLRKSNSEEDVLKFATGGQVVKALEKLKEYTELDFKRALKRVFRDRSKSFKLRKRVFGEYLLARDEITLSMLDARASEFDPDEWKQIASELRQWSKASDARKRKVVERFGQIWFEVFKSRDVEEIDLCQVRARGHRCQG